MSVDETFAPGDRVILLDGRRRHTVVGPPADGPLRRSYWVVQDEHGLPLLVHQSAIVHEADFDPGAPGTAFEVLDRALDDLDEDPPFTGRDLIRMLNDAGYRVLPR